MKINSNVSFSICCAEQPEYFWSITMSWSLKQFNDLMLIQVLCPEPKAALEERLINLATLDYEVCCMLQPKVVNGSFVISASGLTEA